MSYKKRLSLFILIDSFIVLTAIFFGFFLTNASTGVITTPIVLSSLAIVLSHHAYSLLLHVYKKAWEYASVGEMIIICKVVTLSILTAALTQQMMLGEIFFRLLAVTWLLHMSMIGGSRFCWRVYRDNYLHSSEEKKRALIIGAGSAGTMVARQLLRSSDSVLKPVAFIDDDLNKHQLDILGLPVVGSINQITKTVDSLGIDNIIIAIPSLGRKDLNIIFQECAKTKAKTQILPMLEDIVTGRVSVNGIRDVEVEDLLGRSPVVLDMDRISEYVTDRVVLVTGAGGSIGSELCRQISLFSPKKLVLLGHGENSIYSIEQELKEKFGHLPIEYVTEIADLQDAKKMMNVMGTHHPAVVYHAAAHKHVPLMERNPEEAVKNNIIGTRNVAEAASWHGVETFVMVSTDKAVNPTSVMGATKRLAEMIVQNMDQKSKTNFVAVRFGNVLGSRGSVIPLFKKQIAKGGPVTVTHPDMIRYFMTIPEASRLVIQAGALARGGEIFVLDMGEPVKIVDLAKNLIKLSGYTIEEIGIEFTGIRPGEKLFEELLKDDEVQEKQVFPNIYIGKPATLYLEDIDKIVQTFHTMEKEKLKEVLVSLANNKVKRKKATVVSISG
ncbi:polysaccharide biosynthesis protein [Robertmurraya beringensis]|uniref:Polysaccharide biosynthesis protein n=1 Tax=Robertmurraya beringensis TaxID=641660 RepID=A0ABV6KYJ2_9BACI